MSLSEGAVHELAVALEGVCIGLEPLRARTEELVQLAHSFVVKYNRQFGKRLEGMSDAVISCLQAHPWPGNLRELENVIERAVLVCDGTVVNTADLPLEIAQPGLGAATQENLQGLKAKVRNATSRIERELIARALQQSGGNVTHAARVLKISRKGLQLKMKELGLRERDERTG
jgi:DNA-binding NtrC family response regulator